MIHSSPTRMDTQGVLPPTVPRMRGGKLEMYSLIARLSLRSTPWAPASAASSLSLISAEEIGDGIEPLTPQNLAFIYTTSVPL